jgi:hypothetical protein
VIHGSCRFDLAEAIIREAQEWILNRQAALLGKHSEIGSPFLARESLSSSGLSNTGARFLYGKPRRISTLFLPVATRIGLNATIPFLEGSEANQ